MGKPVGLVEVMAIDILAGKNKALKELMLTIDAINFYSDIIPYQKGYIYLPGENERCKINIPVISNGENPNFSFGYEIAGPLMSFSFLKLFDVDKERKLGFSKVSDLLSQQTKWASTETYFRYPWAQKLQLGEEKKKLFYYLQYL